VAFSASGSDRQILPVPRLSEAGSLVMSEMSPSRQRPRVLIDAFKAGSIPRAEMPELIQFAWTYDDSPTSDVGEAAAAVITVRAPGRSGLGGQRVQVLPCSYRGRVILDTALALKLLTCL
jgi:hypothetical protein